MYSRLDDHLAWAEQRVTAAIAALPDDSAERAQALHLSYLWEITDA